jgi:Fe-S-cluster containining protein
MSSSTPEPDKSETLFEPLTTPTFSFRCHKGMECFTRCCAALNLLLTPYDILRLKKSLGLTSDEFLLQHTEMRFDAHPRFPMVRLKMRVGDKNCPFVTPEGCRVYPDRPGACRIYPIGRASMKLDQEKRAREKFFVVREGHCLGFNEERTWTIEEWTADQGLEEYSAMNDLWLEIISSQKSLGTEKEIPRKLQMFSMASYNLDKFRKFVFESRFLQLFDVDSEVSEGLAEDDRELMGLAFRWLKFSLFGLDTMKIKIR